MQIKSATLLRSDYNEIARIAKTTQQPVYITRNGEGDTVLMDIDAFEARDYDIRRREAILEHREAVLAAEFARLEGKGAVSADTLRGKLQQKFDAARTGGR